MEQNYKAIQNDNYALREYVIQLQSRLLDVSIDPPQPPPNINLASPIGSATAAGARSIHPSLSSPTVVPVDPATTGPNRGTLADVAAAVAGLSSREPDVEDTPESIYPKTESIYPKPPSFNGDTSEDMRNGDGIERQLQLHDGLPSVSLRT